MNFNKAIIVGRLTRDPESRPLPSGQSVVSFSLATNRAWNNKEGAKQEATEYHNIVVFGKLAEICSRYLNKGRLVLIEGRLQTRSWQDQNGTKHYRTEIVAENMQMGPRSGNEQGSANSENQQPAMNDIPIIESNEPVTDNNDQVNVENIPF